MSVNNYFAPLGRRPVRRLVTTLGALLLLVSCSTAQSGDSDVADNPSAQTSTNDAVQVGEELTSINLGISPFQDTLLPIIGDEQGWFEEAGLDITMDTLSWDAVMPAVASGAVDVAINNTTGVVSVANRAPDVVYWYGWNPFTEGSTLIGRPDAELDTVDDLTAEGVAIEEARERVFNQLNGKEIVTTMATDMGKQVVAALQSVDLSESDVTLIDLDPDQGLAAFLSGTGDVYLGGVPQRARALEEGNIIVASGPDLAPPPINGFVTTATFAEENEDALLRLMNVMFRIVRYCNDNTDACGETITAEMNAQTGAEMTVEGFADFWQNIEDYAGNPAEVEEWILSEDGFSYWKDTWDGDNTFLTESGAIDDPVAADDHFLADRTHQAYIEKYGADETDY